MRKSICILEGVRQALETSEEIRQQDGATLTTVASTHFCREVGYVVNTRFFGLRFYSDLTQTNENRLRHDSDI